MTDPRTTVRAGVGGLDIGGAHVPLVSGEVQFWRLEPDDWGPVLDAVVDAGVPIVSTYLSWRRHEPERGRFEWGADDPRLDATRFVRECAERGLYVQLKPGPWICAEEPGGGYPDWLMARTGDLALDAAGRTIGGYNPPFVHPVPSVHAAGYRVAARDWLSHVWAELGPLARPGGPVVAVQLDNEPGYAFQDALYFADYHPAAVEGFREWLARRYGDVAAWRTAWGPAASDDFAGAEPPRPAGATGDPIAATTASTPPSEVALRDWVTFTADSIAGHLRGLWQVHEELGFGHLLPTVNLINHPVHDVPVSHATVRRALAGRAAIGGDQYYEPPIAWEDVNRLALTAATARSAGEPVVWAPELMSGIWRSPGETVGYPDPTPSEQAAWWGAALALGYQGFNLYMLADRENWGLAPIGRHGASTPLLSNAGQLARLLRDDPGVAQGRPRAAVLLLWDDEDAFAAYAATGTARQPEVPWGSAEEGLAYRETVRLGAELLAAGFTYDLWHPRRGPAPTGTTIVGSAASRWLRRDAGGRRVVPVEPGVPVADVLAPQRPPVRLVSAGQADAGGVAVLHDAPQSTLLHVARWADVPSDLVLAGSWPAGTWSPLLGATATLERLAPNRWRLPAQTPHLVLRWTSRISHESADDEEP